MSRESAATSTCRRGGIALLLLVGLLPAMPYDRAAFVSQADEHWNNSDPAKIDTPRFQYYECQNCAEFGSQCAYEGGVPFLRKSEDFIGKWNNQPHYGVRDDKPHPPLIHNVGALRDYLESFGGQHEIRDGGNDVPSWIEPGDFGFLYPNVGEQIPYHTVPIILPFTDGDGHRDADFATNCDPHHSKLGPDKRTFRQKYGERKVEWVHVPSILRYCMQPKQLNNIDSTFKDKMDVFFKYKCCWHEQSGAPWIENPSFYACLGWEEARGLTWDTMKSPRFNLAGCTDVQLRQWSWSTLQTGTNTIEIRGSTDDGATWPHLIAAGSDPAQAIVLPWAANRESVRVAWIYVGHVQKGRYWCVDDIEIQARPSLFYDLSVTEVRWPRGKITQGRTIVPKVWVWNSGSKQDSGWVKFRMYDYYKDSVYVRLWPYQDSLVAFSGWVATPGPHFAECFVEAALDEQRHNDTATMSFSVVADQWDTMFPVYGGFGMRPGACITTTHPDTLYCSPGRYCFFADYIVSQNLWKTRAPTIKNFAQGAGLTYPPHSNLIFAVRGSGKEFYRYNKLYNFWERLHNTKWGVGSNGTLAWGGGERIYLLRGKGYKGFARYYTTGDYWEDRANTPDGTDDGASLVWTGGDSLFALRGGGGREFYLYRISTNTWTTLSAQTPAPVGDGGALAYDPLTNKIYAFFGGNTRFFGVYDIASGGWSLRAPAPNVVYEGGCLTYCDHSVFGGIGTDHEFYRYSPPVGGFLGEGHFGTEPSDQPISFDEPITSPSGRVLDPGELLTFDPRDKHTPQYSPNGLWIAYTAYDSARDCNGLYRIPASGGLAQAMTLDSLDYEDPEWASSGFWLVAAADDGIYKITLGGSSVRLAQGIVSGPHVFAGDTWILYQKWDSTTHSHHVCKVRADGTGDTCLTPAVDEYLEPQPITGTAFASVKLKDEVYQLSKDSAGQQSWLTSDYMHNVGLQVSPDKQWLVYAKLDESGYWQIYKMRADGTEETRITDGACNCETPVFSPNGQYVAYTKWPVDSTGSSEFSQVCYRNVVNPVAEVALNSANACRENPCWSPNCQYIIYEITSEDAALAPGHKKQKQIGRVRTRIKQLSGVEELSSLPRAFALYQNRPNPFGRTTTIRYALPVPSLTELSIYDVSGRTVTRLVQSEQKPGYYSVVWKGTDIRGRSVPAGTYFYILKSNGKIAQKRMLLVR